jgi:hypothetical protein
MVSGDATAPQARTYGGWQQERVAFIFGLTAPRAAMLAAATLAAILPIATVRMSAAAVLWPAAAALSAAALVRVQGRTGDEWAASLVSYLLIALRGQHRYAGGPFTPPNTAGNDDGTEIPMELPGILAPLRILSVPVTRGDVAVVAHRYDRTYTAVARVRIPGIGLADSVRQDQRVAGWGALLASLCTEGSPLIRVQALQRLVPDPGAALRSWHQSHLTTAAPDLAVQVTGQLLAETALATSRREAYLAVTMDARRAHGQIKSAGGGDAGAAAVLVRHLRAMQQSLASAELEVEGWLAARDLAEVIRTAYDPDSLAPLAARRAAHTPRNTRSRKTIAPGTSPALAGPVYAEARPGSYVHDGAVTVSYWVQDWPRSHAWCTALGPLLADGSHRRSFGMIFEPLNPRAAERQVMRERTARHVAVRMRQRTGQIVPEHEQAAMELALRQDAERAAGHGLVRFTAYVAVTVTEPGSVEDACAALEADAAAARIELRKMWFAQDSGFALAALPLAMGLPRRRW